MFRNLNLTKYKTSLPVSTTELYVRLLLLPESLKKNFQIADPPKSPLLRGTLNAGFFRND